MTENKAYTYNEIPKLHQLLPETGGLPGVTYAIVALENARKAQDQGWSRLTGNQKIFTVVGPNGAVDCELYGKGAPIRGLDASGGRRTCVVDKAVSKLFSQARTAGAPKGASAKSATKD
jgi:hypothetical protein